MYTIWVLALALGAVSADIGLGYHYKVPETSYGVPSYQIGNSGRNTGFTGSSTHNLGSISSGTGFTGNSFTTAQAPSFSTGSSNTDFANGYASGLGTGFNYAQANTGGSGFNYNTQGFDAGYKYHGLGGDSSNQGFFQGSTGQNAQSGLNGYYQTGGSSIAGSQPSLSGGSGYYNQYQTAAVNKYQEYYNQIVQQPPQVFKHFYVHAAPEEPPVAKPRQPLVLPPAQKHYKIIFIKTPEQHAPAPQIIPVSQQNEEKTIVYVLVKNPEDEQNIVLPKIEPKPPTKPEVFFIKYDDKQDSQSVINNIVNDYDKGGVPTSFASVGTDYAGVKESGQIASSGVIGGVSSPSGFGSLTSGNTNVFGSTTGGSQSGFGSSNTGSTGGFGSLISGNTNGFGSSNTGNTGGFGSLISGNTNGFGSATSGSTGGFGSATGGSSISDGSYAVSSTSSGNTFGGTVSETANQGSSSFGSQFTSAGPTVVTSSNGENSLNSGLERIFGAPGSSISTTTASSLSGFDTSAISTSQGVPHESYGVPKFKEN